MPRKQLKVYFFPPHARPVPVKMGLERNRSAVGKTANSLVSPRPQQLTPLPCGGPARPLPGTKAIRRANFRLGHAGRRARTVSGCVNSAFHNISQHFTGHLFRPWIPNLTRCQHFLVLARTVSGCLNSAFLGLEQNRSAVGNTKAPLALPRPSSARECHTLSVVSSLRDSADPVETVRARGRSAQ